MSKAMSKSGGFVRISDAMFDALVKIFMSDNGMHVRWDVDVESDARLVVAEIQIKQLKALVRKLKGELAKADEQERKGIEMRIWDAENHIDSLMQRLRIDAKLEADGGAFRKELVELYGES